MSALTSTTDNDGIAIVQLDVSEESMNILNQAVMDEFSALLDKINTDKHIKAVVITSAKKDCFIAGADISMLQATQTAQEGEGIVKKAHQLLQKIANSSTPFICAIDGVCLGAGYELALACHYRIASDNPKTKMGLPEVMLGLLPGATGTTKLSRLIPLDSALDVMLTGKQLNAKRAYRLGMIDEVVAPTILLEAAKKVAHRLMRQRHKRRQPLKQKLMRLPGLSHLVLYKAKQQVLKKTKGLYPAPLAIIDVIEKGFYRPLDEALAYEAQCFGELSVSPQAKQLINIYFATTALKKEYFTSEPIEPQTIKQLGVLGGGLMGSGIAIVSIDKADVLVRIKEINDKGLAHVYGALDRYYRTRVRRKILSEEAAKKKTNQLTSSLDFTGFGQCDLVIEAVFEDLKIKHEMLKAVEDSCSEHTIFASNTSSIPISDIASQAQRPDNVIGMHYFSPVEKMPLLEIIKHAGTSEQTISTAVDFGRKQGKTVIVVNDGAGFYVNRILTPYMNAALSLGLEGVGFDRIDEALVNFGFPVGPIKLLDEVGVDIASKILPILEAAFGERMQGCGLQQTLINKGRLGKKVKKGFYQYHKKNNKPLIDDSIYDDLGMTKSIEMSDKQIVERCLYPMLNEAILCLEEGIIDCPRDGDIGAIFSIGFPPFLGGPFRYIETLGIKQVTSRLNELAKQHNSDATATRYLAQLEAQGHHLYPER